MGERISVAPRPLGQRGRVHVQNMRGVLRTTRRDVVCKNKHIFCLACLDEWFRNDAKMSTFAKKKRRMEPTPDLKTLKEHSPVYLACTRKYACGVRWTVVRLDRLVTFGSADSLRTHDIHGCA